MHSDPSFFVRFWGVRGSIACPGPAYNRYGGNTACLEVGCDGRLLIFDAGTGLRELGKKVDVHGAVDADIFFTHAHLDHVGGLPFFSSAFNSENKFRLWSGHLDNNLTMKHVLDRLMSNPLFPVPFEVFQADISFHNFLPGDEISLTDKIIIYTTPLNHPQGAVGYRVDYEGKSICYVSDTEHYSDRIDENVLKLVNGADVVIYDATYTDEEYANYVGWGHSTWQEGIKLCNAAGVKKLILFHHDPTHDDGDMDSIASNAEKARPGTIVAKEGMVVIP